MCLSVFSELANIFFISRDRKTFAESVSSWSIDITKLTEVFFGLNVSFEIGNFTYFVPFVVFRHTSISRIFLQSTVDTKSICARLYLYVRYNKTFWNFNCILRRMNICFSSSRHQYSNALVLAQWITMIFGSIGGRLFFKSHETSHTCTGLISIKYRLHDKWCRNTFCTFTWLQECDAAKLQCIETDKKTSLENKVTRRWFSYPPYTTACPDVTLRCTGIYFL